MRSLRYAEHAREAWRAPETLALRGRAFARRQVLRAANLMHDGRTGNVVRCLYGHAVFPEQREALRAIVRALKNGGAFIDTPTLIEMLRSGAAPDGRYFHLSFDDGCANVYEEGGAVLAEEGVPYTMFIPTDLIDRPIETIDRYNEERLRYALPIRTLTWAQVREAAARGVEIGCHTHTHARLSEISGDPGQLRDEVAGAKARIERETGVPCLSFAWPFGKMRDVDDRAIAAIRDAGFQICFSAERGRVFPGGADMMKVPRHQVELHWPVWENLLWARGYRDTAAAAAR